MTTPSGDFCFLAVNDLHFAGEDTGEGLDRIIRRMNSHPEQPEFCLLLGDLVEHGSETELRTVRTALEGLAMPWQAVLGNHDPAPDGNLSAWDAVFPGPRNYAFNHRGMHFIGLDTTAGTAYENTAISEQTLGWLNGHLRSVDPKQPVVLFTHFPLGEGVRYRPVNAPDLLELISGHNVRLVLGGHFHAATEVLWRGVPLVTGPCCSPTRANHDGSLIKGYQLCRARGERIERTFVPVEFPA